MLALSVLAFIAGLAGLVALLVVAQVIWPCVVPGLLVGFGLRGLWEIWRT